MKLWYGRASEDVHVYFDARGAPIRGLPRPEDIDDAAQFVAVSTPGSSLAVTRPVDEPDPEFVELAEVIVHFAGDTFARFAS